MTSNLITYAQIVSQDVFLVTGSDVGALKELTVRLVPKGLGGRMAL